MANIRVWSYIICRIFFICSALNAKNSYHSDLERKTSLGLKAGRKNKIVIEIWILTLKLIHHFSFYYLAWSPCSRECWDLSHKGRKLFKWHGFFTWWLRLQRPMGITWSLGCLIMRLMWLIVSMSVIRRWKLISNWN